MPPDMVTVTLEVVGFADWEPNWKVFRGDAGLVRGLGLAGRLCVVGFETWVSFTDDPAGLLGEEDREEG